MAYGNACVPMVPGYKQSLPADAPGGTVVFAMFHGDGLLDDASRVAVPNGIDVADIGVLNHDLYFLPGPSL
eukprot:1215096-Lingulodinium_polyedra.AAC.1